MPLSIPACGFGGVFEVSGLGDPNSPKHKWLLSLLLPGVPSRFSARLPLPILSPSGSGQFCIYKVRRMRPRPPLPTGSVCSYEKPWGVVGKSAIMGPGLKT